MKNLLIDFYYNDFITWKEKKIKDNTFVDDSLYPKWHELYKYYEKILTDTELCIFSNEDLYKTIFLIGRDNEDEELIEIIYKLEKNQKRLVENILKNNDVDAKWQLANCISRNHSKNYMKELIALFENENEYVSRMALLALGNLKYEKIEMILEKAWNTNYEYHRIAVLSILYENNMANLDYYLEKAKFDNRPWLLSYINKIQENP